MSSAIAVFHGPGITGNVRFDQSSSGINITLNVKGLKPNGYHGFHIHEYGDLTDGCQSACAHFNPHNKKHGGPHSLERHVGDLGNITSDLFGNAKYTTSDSVITLTNQNGIVGRMLIIHEDRDDCGLGGDEESLRTGNAGKRIACAVIGYCK